MEENGWSPCSVSSVLCGNRNQRLLAGWRRGGRDVSLLHLLLSGRAVESVSEKKTELEKDSESSGHNASKPKRSIFPVFSPPAGVLLSPFLSAVSCWDLRKRVHSEQA